MKKSDVYPSKYLAADDIGNKRVTVIIDRIEMEELKNREGKTESKPIVYFKGKIKGMVLNVTNWDRIEHVTGLDDSDEWPGEAVGIHTELVSFAGKTGPALRITLPGKTKDAKDKPERPTPKAKQIEDTIEEETENIGEVIDDEIPGGLVMVNNHALVEGSIVDARNVGVHKSVKITVHIPEEYFDRFYTCFGWPTMTEPVPVILARLAEPEPEEAMHEEDGCD